MKKDSAVSPVIGSILLVAITVIIAAVIAAFVFGMTGDIQQTRIVAITSDVAQNSPDAKMIVITNHGGKDVATLNKLTVKINGTDCDADGLKTVGSSVKCVGGSPGQRDHVVVVGVFVDGTNQVLLDTYQ